MTGASSGLGRHFAGALAAAGAKVTVAARRQEGLAETAAIQASGAAAHAVRMDITNAPSIAHAFTEAEAKFGLVAVLINNAGVTSSGAAVDMTPADWSSVIGTNLRGSWVVATHTARRTIQQGGSIVSVDSILGLRVTGVVAPYTVSKAGVIQMTKALALEWTRHKIRVNALAPGYVETDLNEAFFANEAGKGMVGCTPQRRLGMARVLDGALLLASEAGSYMTGSVVAGNLVSNL